MPPNNLRVRKTDYFHLTFRHAPTRPPLLPWIITQQQQFVLQNGRRQSLRRHRFNGIDSSYYYWSSGKRFKTVEYTSRVYVRSTIRQRLFAWITWINTSLRVSTSDPTIGILYDRASALPFSANWDSGCSV